MNVMPSVKEGYFKMLKPAYNKHGFWIVGGIVGITNDIMPYTKRVRFPKDIAAETERVKIAILKDHPGIIEVFGQMTEVLV